MNSRRAAPWFESVPAVRRYPVLKGNHHADVVVVGGGVVGARTASNLARRGLDVMLLEADLIASGASGINAGFLTRVPNGQISDLCRRHGIGFVRAIFEATANAERQIIRLAQTTGLNLDLVECDTYAYTTRPHDDDFYDEWNTIRRVDCRAALVEAEGRTGVPMAQAMVFGGEARLNPRKLVFSLLESALEQGVKVHEKTSVVTIETGSTLRVLTRLGAVIANRVVLATGAPPSFLSHFRPLVTPATSQVMAVRYADGVPFSDDLFWNSAANYFAFRRLDNEIALVSQHHASGRRAIASFLRKTFHSRFIVQRHWTGALLETQDGLPYVVQDPRNPKVTVCTGLGGNGLVMGVMAADIATDSAASRPNRLASLLSTRRHAHLTVAH